MGSTESIPESTAPGAVRSRIVSVRSHARVAIFMIQGVMLLAAPCPVFADESSLVRTTRLDRAVPLQTIGVRDAAAAAENALQPSQAAMPPTVIKPDAMLAAVNGFGNAMSARTASVDEEAEA